MKVHNTPYMLKTFALVRTLTYTESFWSNPTHAFYTALYMLRRYAMNTRRTAVLLFCSSVAAMTLKPIPGKHISERALNLSTCPKRARPPIIVSDVLDTLVVDPFFNGMAAHFGFENFSDFVSAKTPDVWVNFELGHINEEQLAEQFFKDHRPVNLPEFKNFLKQSYHLVPGIDMLLNTLREANLEVHLCSNYPMWDDLIEESIQLNARYGARWTFVSGKEGVRKPDASAYQRVAAKAGVQLSSCILLDDRKTNCEGALDAGYLAAIHFRDAKQAASDLAEVLESQGVILDLSTHYML